MQMSLEKVIDVVLKGGDLHGLELFLEKDTHEAEELNCSKQFVSKLDKLFKRCFAQKRVAPVSMVLAVLSKCENSLIIAGLEGLSGIINQGLVKKWFEKCRQLWIDCGPHFDEIMLTISEDFFECLVVVHEACKGGAFKITESLLFPIGQLAMDPRINIAIQKEAMRVFNTFLGKIPTELKKQKKILMSQEASNVMIRLANHALECGDYDLQVTVMEALFRMASSANRKELAYRLFSVDYISDAFVKIQESEFETDCRKFLNLVNGMQTDRRVVSLPCQDVYLDNCELRMPCDDKLEEFWVDFNLGSHSISFYFSLANDEDGQWETLCIREHDLQSYTIRVEDTRQILRLRLTEVVVVSVREGSNLTITFSSSVNVLQAVESVFGQSKNKKFVGKKSTSVVKTTVKVVMDENSQTVVPESQISACEKEKTTGPHSVPSAPALAQMVTPAKSRMSESTTFISSSSGDFHVGRSSLAVKPIRTDKVKPSLEMVYTHDIEGEFYCGQSNSVAKGSDVLRQGTTKTHAVAQQRITQGIGVETHKAGKAGKQKPPEQDFVPETQPAESTQENIHPQWSKEPLSETTITPPLIEKTVSPSCLAQQFESPRSILREPLHEQVACQEWQSEISGDRHGRSTAGKCDPASSIFEKQQIKTIGHTKLNNKSQMLPKASAPPLKASEAEAVIEKSERFKRTGAFSKESQNAEVAGSMVKLISNHYQMNRQFPVKAVVHGNLPSRSVFGTSPLSAAKREVNDVSGPRKPLHKNSKKRSTSKTDLEDIFAFSVEEPSRRGVNCKLFTDTCTISKSVTCDNKLPRTTKKRQAKETQRVQRHLFSDSDDDAGAKTDVSWIRESCKIPKPKFIEYTRQAHDKTMTAKIHPRYESPDVIPLSSKPNRKNDKQSKEKTCAKESKVQPMKDTAGLPQRPATKSRRPQRVAASAIKCYKELDTEDSLSESEVLMNWNDQNRQVETTSREVPLTKRPVGKQSKKIYRESLSGHRSPQPEPQAVTKRSFLAQHQMTLESQTKETKNLGDQSTTRTGLENESPIYFDLPRAIIPQMTSTSLERDTLGASTLSPLQSPLFQDTFNNCISCNFSKESHISQSLSSDKASSPGKLSVACAMAHKVEKTPTSFRNLKSAHSHRSGVSHKRHISHSWSSSSEDDDDDQGKEIGNMRQQEPPRMKPRKLFKSVAEPPAEDERSQGCFYLHTTNSTYLEAEVQEMDEGSEFPDVSKNTAYMCQQVSLNLKKKFKGHAKMMESYSKQSLKTIQQHLSTLYFEVSKHRTQRLNKMCQALQEEIQCLEQDTFLQNMEKDLTTYRNKQTMALGAYKQQETKRYETMKEALAGKMCGSLQYEERLFTSQMCLMSTENKSVQGRLIDKMHDGEIQAVKQGLRALFFPGGTRF